LKEVIIFEESIEWTSYVTTKLTTNNLLNTSYILDIVPEKGN